VRSLCVVRNGHALCEPLIGRSNRTKPPIMSLWRPTPPNLNRDDDPQSLLPFAVLRRNIFRGDRYGIGVQCLRWKEPTLHPVNYDVRQAWLSSTLGRRMRS